eukprot:CAMPEP_0119022436 /NCGR_PEP_ID=MMETSP1176-20130426/28012_1 /TAXON_ID=265551 /ORGANISM="Synedropsis recta cf, Strain CCMP1620" /LENGTH=185 /DNA_ID=CAMNT_0006977297 /DNA_START=120 /DNA_END=677 /DNA_ORIENTATION=+
MSEEQESTIPFSLVPFGAPNDDIFITGTVVRRRKSLLVVDYQVHDPQIKWPTISLQPSRKDNLWKTTCLEFFLSNPNNSKEYWEINLSPTRDWNVYHFDDYRSGMKRELRVTSGVEINVDPDTKKHKLTATLDLSELELLATQPLDMSVTAVIENLKDDSQTFWALTHTGDEADFHRRDSFILKI